MHFYKPTAKSNIIMFESDIAFDVKLEDIVIQVPKQVKLKD
jgi:hypothetical protein